jgi:hypothetical protein
LRHGRHAQEKRAKESFGWKIHTCMKTANGRDVKRGLLPDRLTSRHGAPRS